MRTRIDDRRPRFALHTSVPDRSVRQYRATGNAPDREDIAMAQCHDLDKRAGLDGGDRIHCRPSDPETGFSLLAGCDDSCYRRVIGLFGSRMRFSSFCL